MSPPMLGLGGRGQRHDGRAGASGASQGGSPGPRKRGPRGPYTAAGSVCESCKVARARCDGGLPCARCFRLNKVCRPLTTKPKKRGRKPKNGIKEEGDEEAASVATWGDSSRASIAPGFSLAPVATAGGSSPLLDLVIDRANPRCFNEMYLQAFSFLYNSELLARDRIVALVRGWRVFAETIGQDPTFGLMGHMRRALGITDVELEGPEGLVQDSPAAVRRKRAQPDVLAMAAAAQEIKRTDVFRMADDGVRSVSLYVYAFDRFVVATNDAHDRRWRSNVELFQEAVRRRIIPHLLLASVVDPTDRFTFYRGLLHLYYGKDPAKVHNFLKMVDRSGEIDLYLVEGRRVKLNGFDGILVITEPAPPSKHISARTDLLAPTSTFPRPLKAIGRSTSEASLGSESTDSGLLFPKGSSARRGRRRPRPEATTGGLPHPPSPVLGTALPTDPCRRMSALFEGDGFVGVLDGLFGRGGSSRRGGGAGGGGGLMGSLAGYGFGGLGGLIGVLRGLRVRGGIKEEEKEEEEEEEDESEDSDDDEESGNGELPPPLLALLEYWENQEQGSDNSPSPASAAPPITLPGFSILPGGIGDLAPETRAHILSSLAARSAGLKPSCRERVLAVLISRANTLPHGPRTIVLDAVAAAAAYLPSPARAKVMAKVAARGVDPSVAGVKQEGAAEGSNGRPLSPEEMMPPVLHLLGSAWPGNGGQQQQQQQQQQERQQVGGNGHVEAAAVAVDESSRWTAVHPPPISQQPQQLQPQQQLQLEQQQAAAAIVPPPLLLQHQTPAHANGGNGSGGSEQFEKADFSRLHGTTATALSVSAPMPYGASFAPISPMPTMGSANLGSGSGGGWGDRANWEMYQQYQPQQHRQAVPVMDEALLRRMFADGENRSSLPTPPSW